MKWAVLALSLLLTVGPARATEAGWALLREGGHVVLLRHAAVIGFDEPANFDIENCRTQRNLSERGKLQARRIGALFAARAAPIERVLSSRYCRCLETAGLAFGERNVEEFEPLDSYADDSEEALQERGKAVIEEVASYTGSGNFVLVTHLANIMSLTGQSAREGEAVIVRADGERLQILGRIVFN